MRVRLAVLALVAGVLLGSTACGGGAGSSSGSGGDSGAGAAGAAGRGGDVGQVANLSFKAETLDGKQFDGATLSGRPVVLWFWAPWCGTCAGQAALVTDVAAKQSGKVTVVGVAGLGEVKAMHEFVADTKVAGFVQLADKAGTVWKLFGVTDQSSYVLLDGSGRVIHKGWLDAEQFETAVAKLAA